MLHSGDLDFSFSGLKTAVLMQVKGRALDAQARADIAAEFQAAIVEVLVAKSLAALERSGLRQSGGRGRRRRQPGAARAAHARRRTARGSACFIRRLNSAPTTAR